MISRAWVGSRNVHGQLGDVAKFMASNNARGEALRSGFIADSMVQGSVAQARFQGNMAQLYQANGPAQFSSNPQKRALQVGASKGLDNANRFANQAAETTLRLSGLTIWTQAGRHAHGMELMGLLADNAGKTLKELEGGDGADKAFGRLIRRYGLSDHWDEIRGTKAYQPEKGVKFLRPDEIRANGNRRLAERVMAMINNEIEFAVPTASSRAQATAGGGARPGTILGELSRSTLMYKSFSMTILYQLNTRAAMAALENGGGHGWKYAASSLALMSIFGAASIQMKEIAKGKDPRDATDWKFAMASAAQGGGLGIFGDFFFADVNRFGGGLAETAAGPVVGLASDIQRLTVGNLQQAANGDETNFGRDATEFARRYTPGSSIWYLRNVWDRMMVDQFQNLIDPEIESYRNRKVARQERTTGNGYYWAPGDALPSRAPDLSEAVKLDE